MNISDYQISYQQVSPLNFHAEIISPENNKFTCHTIQCHPLQINKQGLFQSFAADKKCQHWILNVESEVIEEKVEKKSEVIGDIVVDSVTSTIKPIESPIEIKVENKEEIKDNPEDKIVIENKELVKDNVIYES